MINPTLLLKKLLLLLLCLSLLAPALSLTLSAAPPNIVYIIADDHTYRDFGFMGSPDALTPHLDRLAAQSARFPNGYVTTSLCSPSLGVLLTGRYPHQSGLHYNHPPPGNSAFNRMTSRTAYEQARSPAFAIIQNQPTLPRTLGTYGYRSFQTGKYWEGHFSTSGFTEGMTLFEPAPGQDFGGNRTLASGELAAHGNGDHGLKIGRETMQPIADFLDRTPKDQPFFIWYAPYLPHLPHDSPQKYFERHQGQGRNVATHRIPYLASVSQFDDTVGELVAMIEKRGLAQNTLFVFVSDNGWTPSTTPDKKHAKEFAGTKESKYSPFEDGLRTPILLRWDGVISPATHPQLVSSIDLLPTVLDAIGKSDAIPNLPGRSLLSAAQGTETLSEKPVFGEIYPGDATSLGQPEKDIAYRWIRLGDYKLIVPHRHAKAKPWNNYLSRPALYNVATDPAEQHDLSADPAQKDRLSALTKRLDTWWNPSAGMAKN